MTSAPLRISAPACVAAVAMAWVSAPMPPWANHAEPAGCGSAAARISSTRLLPADHGPRNVPKMPRAAMVARSNSVSKNSATRSATAMGPQRSRRYMSFLPRPRTPRPVLSMPHKSPALGESMSGGVKRQHFRNDFADLGQRLLKLRDTWPRLSKRTSRSPRLTFRDRRRDSVRGPREKAR